MDGVGRWESRMASVCDRLGFVMFCTDLVIALRR